MNPAKEKRMNNVKKLGPFAETIMLQKYSHEKDDGSKETWEEIAARVAKKVMKCISPKKSQVDRIEKFIAQRKFMPGGRYLYAAGRPFHQVQNCLLLRAEDSREGWADLLHKSTMALMTGAGIGIVYSDVRGEGRPIRKTGGTSTGPLALMQMVNEAGRGIMQGGSRRSAIWAGLHWNHPDIHKFIQIKNWSQDVRNMKEKDYNSPAPLDGTNISVILNDEFFEAYDNEKNAQHSLAQGVYWAVVRQMLKTAEPGFSIDTGVNKNENCRNACVSGETEILTSNGYYRIDSLLEKTVDVWNGFEWSSVTPKITGHNKEMVTVHLSSGQSIRCTPEHTFWLATDYKGNKKEQKAAELQIGDKLIKTQMPVIYEGRDFKNAYTQGFVSGDGMDGYKFFELYDTKYMCESRLDIRIGAENKKEGKKHVTLTFDALPKNFVPFSWNLSSRLNWMAGILDSDGTELREGGSQISSVDKQFLLDIQKMLTTMGVVTKVTLGMKAGMRMLPDGHGGRKLYPCKDSYRLLIGAVQIQELKELGMKCERLHFNKCPQRDASQFVTVIGVEESGFEETVYCFNEPKRHLGCFDGVVTGQCTEVTSEDDSDICNLGSINMAEISSLEEMQEVVDAAVLFLMAGTIYSDVPYAKVDQIRRKNRRLGLGLMGLHEWLLKKGKLYGPDAELEEYLKIYATSTEIAKKYAKELDVSAPVKTRAIAPTGTIGIVAETTTGIEPIFCVAYKRRYLKGSVVNYQYVIDPCAQRLIDGGVSPENIEDAYVLAENVERRVEFQHWLQKYVDHSISSTINLPAWGSELNNEGKVRPFGDMLMKYLPGLRGITCYPDGARGGQPLTPVKYTTAIKHVGEVFSEQVDICDITKGGSCGS
jgi:ribonucleotide reductase alpha subunit